MDSRAFGARVFWAIAVICAGLVLADLFYPRHGHYAAESLVGAYGAYGFVSGVALVLAAVQLRKLVRRDEDYYD